MHETRRRPRRDPRRPARAPDYGNLRHPFAAQAFFSDDAVARMHEAALTLLETHGMRVLHPAAVALYRQGGARVADDMVCIGREIIADALATAPKAWRLRAANPAKERDYATGSMLFYPGAGCPNVSDRLRGRRAGSLEAFRETTILQQAFDVMHIFGPSAEPQDVPATLRHYAMMEAQLTLGDKPMFVYARGTGQVEECFEAIRRGLDLSETDWADGVWATTIINTNSPRQLDRPMAEGIIDFARAGQMAVITPFCLAGAMAPVTVAGALVLQHAEALAGIALSQLARPGAPVSYGGFSSNVDMKSGAPAFGTPEHLKLQIGTGQLARHIGLPFRSATGAASNATDMQAAQETMNGLWGAVLSGATLTVHSAGWLEGGLTFGYEKFINDIEALQVMAELSTAPGDTVDDLAAEALADVQPGGHFFASAHTMARYETAFYSPLLADLSNFGTWTDAGSQPSDVRATAIWQACLDAHVAPAHAGEAAARLAPWLAARRAAGGRAPGE